MKEEWKKKWRKLYGDDFEGGCRDKYEQFFSDLLASQKQEFIKNSKELKELTELIRDLKFNH